MTKERRESSNQETQVSLKNIDIKELVRLYKQTNGLPQVDTVSIPKLSQVWEYPIEPARKVVYTVLQSEKSGNGSQSFIDWFGSGPIEELNLQFLDKMERLCRKLNGTNKTLANIFLEINPQNEDYLEKEVEVGLIRTRSSQGIKL